MIKNVLKGIIIGLASIIPGVSGGTLAVSMGIYDRIIHCINHLFRDLKSNVLFLLPIAVGMGIAVAGSAVGLDYLFETFPLQTNLLFAGLILGSLPPIYSKVKGETIRVGHIFAAILFFVLIAGLAFFNDYQGKEVTLQPGFAETIRLFAIGVLSSATMVIPGISGSMLLILLGYYNPILDSIKAFVIAAVKLDIAGALNEVYLLAPFGIGLVIGIFAIAKIVEIIFEKFPLYAYWAIIGLIIASPVAILFVASITEVTAISVLTGVLAFFAGMAAAVKLGD